MSFFKYWFWTLVCICSLATCNWFNCGLLVVEWLCIIIVGEVEKEFAAEAKVELVILEVDLLNEVDRIDESDGVDKHKGLLCHNKIRWLQSGRLLK